MSITSLLAPDRIFTDTDITSKKRLLEFLAEKASEAIELSQTEIFNKLLERERLGSTGLGQGFAVPHARLDNLQHTHACFAKLGTPVNYDAMDHQPVDLIFAIFLPEASTEEHLRILAALAKIFSQPAITHKIRNCNDASEIIRIIEQAEQSSAT
jgi:PTS system nitrogen regulatory IIA component